MGRTALFQGLTLTTPDAYSYLDVSRLLTPTAGGTGIVALVGESDGGNAGLYLFQGGVNSTTVKNELISGPGANMVPLAARSGNDALVPAGASAILFYQTNTNTPGTFNISTDGVVTSRLFGLAMNHYVGSLVTSLGSAIYTTLDENGVSESSPPMGSAQYLSVTYAGSGTAVPTTLQYSGGSVLQFIATATGTPSDDLTINLTATTTLQQLANAINSNVNYTAVVLNSKGSFLVKDLDLVLTADALDLKAGPWTATAGLYEFAFWSEQTSLLVTFTRAAGNAGHKLPTTVTMANFTGGTRGVSANSDVQAAYNQLLKTRVNITVPLFSSDNQDGSTVVLASVNSIVTAHVTNRSGILGRSECQAYVSIHGDKAVFKAECSRLNSRWVAVTSQNATDLDVDGNLVEFPEYAWAVTCAQTQAGSIVGTPLDYRTVPTSSLTQDSSWDPILDSDEMIAAGTLFGAADENNVLRIVGGYTCWLSDTNNANIYIELVESFAIFGFNHRQFMKSRFQGQSRFSTQTILDAINEDLKAEAGVLQVIKSFDSSLTKIIQASAGQLVYELGVEGWEGIRFILPTIIGVRQAA